MTDFCGEEIHAVEETFPGCSVYLCDFHCEQAWERQRWVCAFWKECFNVRVNTNNGVERQNKLFKYSYLKSHKNNSLTVMLTVLIEDFLPDNYSRLVDTISVF
ncbi:uncharacterized protein [Porites lutea]|uniref:uncharacterized protein n=1 Tax=Porites lutea TaxID=51062 RepID=UPI003CC5326E